MILTTCICGTQDASVVAEAEGHEVGTCTHCGVIRTLTRDDDYASLYVEGERYHAGAMDEIHRPHYKERFDHDMTLAGLRIPRLLEEMRALDVGCANGAFVAALADLGVEAEGLELNPDMAAWAEEHGRITVHTSWATIRPGFDLITYHDVFEHVVEPHEELARARAYLRPHGLLIIDQPDAAEVFGPAARAGHHNKPSQHLWFFSEDTMSRLLTRHGFSIESVDFPLPGKLVIYARAA